MMAVAQILEDLRSRPISDAEAVQNLFIAGKAGSHWARLRLRQIADNGEYSFLVRQAAKSASKQLDFRFGPMQEG